MKRFAAAVLMLILLPSCLLAVQESKQNSIVDFALHIDVDRLKESETGQTLIRSTMQSPFVVSQISTLPEELAFLKRANVHSVTIATRNASQSMPVVQIVADYDQKQFVELIERGCDYAKVQYRDIAIHHWVANLEELGNQFMGEPQPATELSKDPIYLALPQPNRLIFATSLAALTHSVDQVLDGKQVLNESTLAEAFGDGSNLISVFSNAPGFPGETTAVLREDESGQVVLRTAIKCVEKTDIATATLVNQVLNQPEMAKRLLSSSLDKQTSIQSVKTTGSGSDEPRNSISMAMRFDCENFNETLEKFLETSVESSFQGNLLTINARFFVGPVEFIHSTRDSESAKKIEQDFNQLVLVLNAYSSSENRDAAIRIADSGDAETTDATKQRR